MSPVISCRTFRRHMSDWRDRLAGVPEAAMTEHQSACGRCASLMRALDVGVRVLRTTELAWPTSRSTISPAP
jgi:hypothetical protein